MLRRIDRYILQEWLKAFFIVIWLTLGILLLEDMSRNLKNFIERGASFQTVATYYALITPNCLGTVLPIAFFISILYTLNVLQLNGEIIALRASGLTVLSITRSLWGAAIALILLLFLFNGYLLPYTSRTTQNIHQQIDYAAQKRNTQEDNQIDVQDNLCFYNPTSGRLWRINRFSLYTQTGTFATVTLLTKGQEQKRLEAQRITFNPTDHTWHLYHGRTWYFDDQANPTRFEPFQHTHFTCEETPQLMHCITKPLKTLGIHELRAITHFFPRNYRHFTEHRIQYASILASPFICLIIVLIAIPFSLNQVRTSPVVGVSKAVGLLFLYYALGGIGHVLGGQRFLPAIAAAWFPNIALLVAGIVLYRKYAPR